jgi:hypothetical protein
MSTVVPILTEGEAAARSPAALERAPSGPVPPPPAEKGDVVATIRHRKGGTAAQQREGRWVSATSVWDNVANRIAERRTEEDAAAVVTRRRKLADAWLRARSGLASTLALLRRDRATAAVVLLLFAAILGFGTWAVWAGAEAQAAFVRETAAYAGQEALLLLDEQLSSAAYPVLALALVRPARFAQPAAHRLPCHSPPARPVRSRARARCKPKTLHLVPSKPSSSCSTYPKIPTRPTVSQTC